MATFITTKKAKTTLAYEVRTRQRSHNACLAVFGGVGLYALLSTIGNLVAAPKENGLNELSYVFAMALAIWMLLLAYLRMHHTDADILKCRTDESLLIEEGKLIYTYKPTETTYSARWPIQYVCYEMYLADIRDVKENGQLGRIEFRFDGMLYRHRCDGVDEPERITNGDLYLYEYFDHMDELHAILLETDKGESR